MQNSLMGCSLSSIDDPAQTQFLKTRGQLVIYYGTTSGNSSTLSYQFAQDAQQHHFQTKIINLSEFDQNIVTTQKLIVFIVASYGTGGPTGDSEQFYKWLTSQEIQNNILKGVKYTVFALGNSNYETFCGMGVMTDKQIETMGAERIFQIGKGDAQNETTMKDFDSWVQSGLWQVLEDQFPLLEININELHLQQAQFQVQFIKNAPKKSDATLVDLDTYQFHCQQQMESYELPVKQIFEMKKNTSFGNSTIFIDLDSTQISDTGINYQTAGNLILYCENDKKSVLNLCSHLNWQADDYIDIRSNPQQLQVSKLPFPSHIKLEQYLSQYCDILGPPTKVQIYELSKFCKDLDQIKELEFISSYQGREDYDEKIINQRHNLLTLLQKYQIFDLSIQFFVEFIQPLRPRLYTIASSVKMYPKNIHIVVSALKLENVVNGSERYGVCSQYIQDILAASQKKQQTLRVRLSNSSFQFPKLPMVPIILVGPGAAVAPMRAIIQERDYYIEQDKLDQSPFQGPMTLYFGCQTKNEYLFEDEMKEFFDNGTLSELHVALSRQGPEKIYVTDLLASDLNALNHFFFEMQGVMYICGSNKMGRDICSVVETMLKKVKKIPPYMAYKKVAELEKNNQIVKEIWG